MTVTDRPVIFSTAPLSGPGVVAPHRSAFQLLALPFSAASEVSATPSSPAVSSSCRRAWESAPPVFISFISSAETVRSRTSAVETEPRARVRSSVKLAVPSSQGPARAWAVSECWTKPSMPLPRWLR